MKLRFPSKTFLLGEYAVLESGMALLIGHGPFFQVELLAGESAAEPPFHPESPAGRWLAIHPFQGTIRFHDPHGGRGGFGASGAEFLAAWFAGNELPRSLRERHQTAWKAWADSRYFPGSGADILTQAFGVGTETPFFLGIDMRPQLLEGLIPGTMGATLSLFHTGRKLPTHEALAAKPVLPIDRLSELVEMGCEALRSTSLSNLTQAIREYGAAMQELGLVAAPTQAALASLPSSPSLLAAKGCGAMGADVILVLHQNAGLGPWAQANGLSPITDIPL